MLSSLPMDRQLQERSGFARLSRRRRPLRHLASTFTCASLLLSAAVSVSLACRKQRSEPEQRGFVGAQHTDFSGRQLTRSLRGVSSSVVEAPPTISLKTPISLKAIAIAEETSEVTNQFWTWHGYRIRYQVAGPADGRPMLLLHGALASADHWRGNVNEVAETSGCRVYAIDLLGYGLSDKPDPASTEPLYLDPTWSRKPTSVGPPNFYNVATWSAQLADFLVDVAGVGPKRGSPALLVANSFGAIVSLQLAVDRPDLVRAAMLLDPSLRLPHVKKQQWFERPFVPALQWVLKKTELGEHAYNLLAKSTTISSIMGMIYPQRPERVDEDLVNKILTPGLLPGASKVFIDFISYSYGPLVEDLLPQLGRANGRAPVWIMWGELDPWEPASEGERLYAGEPAVERFQILPGLGHCPMDEAPDVANPLMVEFANAHSASLGDSKQEQ